MTGIALRWNTTRAGIALRWMSVNPLPAQTQSTPAETQSPLLKTFWRRFWLRCSRAKWIYSCVCFCFATMGVRHSSCRVRKLVIDKTFAQSRSLFQQLWHALRGGSRGGDWGDRSPLKPMKVTFFTMILNNLENSIRDIRPFCRPLFCHSSDVKYTSYLLQ